MSPAAHHDAPQAGQGRGTTQALGADAFDRSTGLRIGAQPDHAGPADPSRVYVLVVLLRARRRLEHVRRSEPNGRKMQPARELMSQTFTCGRNPWTSPSWKRWFPSRTTDTDRALAVPRQACPSRARSRLPTAGMIDGAGTRQRATWLVGRLDGRIHDDHARPGASRPPPGACRQDQRRDSNPHR